MNQSKFTMKNFQSLLQKIPQGKVTTYAAIAAALGAPRAARAAGMLCGRNPEPDVYPCFKVVRSDGGLGGFSLGLPEKIRRLKNEGIEVKNGKVVNFDAKLYQFRQ